MTQLAGIFGYPLAHSISPAFQQAAFDYYSIPARYEAWSTPPESLGNEVSKLRGEKYLGANVTIPHKESVKALLDSIDDWATSIGAVNTIVHEEGKLHGHNTDAYGFIRSLKEMGNFEPKDKRVLLLGAGGAARAVAFGLTQEGISFLTIANRTLERAESLASEVGKVIKGVSAVSTNDEVLHEASSSADLIVNSTSVGMQHSEGQGQTPLAKESIPSHALVYDLVYNPQETPLLKDAKKAGADVIGGLPMLIYQGAAAFEMWTGKEAPIDIMFKAGQRALNEMASV